MMLYASQGVRNAARKGSNVLVHHGGHNGPGGSTTANTTTRSLHISNTLLGASRVAHAPLPHINTLEAIRPRNPSHKLFSASKGFLQKIFTHLTAPGLRTPTYISQAQHVGTRSLHNASARAASIQGGLSAAARNSLRNNALHRQANIFLPRAPAPAPPRFGGVAQVGLGTARNFTTGRPIFQQLVENVPIAGRALYEVDWDLETQKEQMKLRSLVKRQHKTVRKSKEMIKQSQKVNQPTMTDKEDKENDIKQQMDQYFPEAEVAPVTTYLLIPLAPTPSARMPLRLDPDLSDQEPRLLPPLSYLGAMHVDYSTHTLRVSALFTRLDQANVWERGGVTCSAYSQGLSHQYQLPKDGNSNMDVEGVCTILKVEFVGWTEAEVRSVIGESGSGWCVLEEIRDDDTLSDMGSLAADLESPGSHTPDVPEIFGLGQGLDDPSQSFVLPTLDFSSSFASSAAGSHPPTCEGLFASVPAGMEQDPWLGEISSSSGSDSSESSLSDVSEWIMEPPSTNGYFGQNPGLGLGVTFSAAAAARFNEAEPRESMFS